jgi:hypothetical protein
MGPAALATGAVLRELQRPFAGKRNAFFLRSLGAIKTVVLGGRDLQRTRAAPLGIAAEAACQTFRRWAGKESVPLREESYSADSRTIKTRRVTTDGAVLLVRPEKQAKA